MVKCYNISNKERTGMRVAFCSLFIYREGNWVESGKMYGRMGNAK